MSSCEHIAFWFKLAHFGYSGHGPDRRSYISMVLILKTDFSIPTIIMAFSSVTPFSSLPVVSAIPPFSYFDQPDPEIQEIMRKAIKPSSDGSDYMTVRLINKGSSIWFSIEIKKIPGGSSRGILRGSRVTGNVVNGDISSLLFLGQSQKRKRFEKDFYMVKPGTYKLKVSTQDRKKWTTRDSVRFVLCDVDMTERASLRLIQCPAYKYQKPETISSNGSTKRSSESDQEEPKRRRSVLPPLESLGAPGISNTRTILPPFSQLLNPVPQ